MPLQWTFIAAATGPFRVGVATHLQRSLQGAAPNTDYVHHELPWIIAHLVSVIVHRGGLAIAYEVPYDGIAQLFFLCGAWRKSRGVGGSFNTFFPLRCTAASVATRCLCDGRATDCQEKQRVTR